MSRYSDGSHIRALVALDCLLLTLAFVAAGCESHDPTIRRQQLLEMYPVGVTSLDDVHSKWQPISPDFSIVRPTGDWSALDDAWIRDHALNAQRRINRPVFRCEMFRGHDGLYGLCRCWFYYDEKDKIVDAEWEWQSD